MKLFKLKMTIALGFTLGLSLYAQALDVTFRYIPGPEEEIVRMFVPGTMPEGSANDWGPNANGTISPTAPSLMEKSLLSGVYEKKYTLAVGSTHQYKFHFHFDQSGSSSSWVTDPLNTNRTNDSFQNAILNVTDPLIFQSGLHFDVNDKVTGLSSGIFSSTGVDSIFMILGSDTISDGLSYLDSSGVFYYNIEEPKFYHEGFQVKAFIDSTEYMVFNILPVEIIQEDIPEGVAMGPNFDGQALTIAVLAPGQPLVQLSLTKEDGSVDTTYTMKNDISNTSIWWLSLDNLSAGDYTYAFKMMNGSFVSDPLSRRVKNGRTMVNVGPGGITTADDFVWTDDNYTIPSLDSLFIYELHVDDFAAAGNGKGRFSHVKEKLGHLKDLGVNAIELMPIMEFPGTHNWGYHNTHYAAVEANYGTPKDFKDLVNTAHSMGISVLLDIVWNHANGGNPIWEIQPDISANPYVKADSDLRPNEDDVHFGGLDLDHFTPETQAYVRQVHNIWVEEYHIDGYRFDFTRGIGWSESQPEFGILGWTSALKVDHPEVIQTIEHLPADPYLVKSSDIDAAWHDSFHDRLKDEIFGSNTLSTIENQVIGLKEYDNNSTPYPNHNSAIKYSVSHDEQSLIQEMVEWRGHTLENALRRDLLFTTLLFTSQGIPMIWQGQEYGMKSGWLDTDNDGNWDEHKLSYRPMDWSLENTEKGQRHYLHYKNLANIYKNHPAVRNGYFSILERYPSQKTIVYGNTDPASSRGLMVFANLSSSSVTITNIPVFYNGSWYPVLGGGTEMSATNFTLDSLTIPAYTAYVYSNVVWETLALDNTIENILPGEFSISPAYPNPFNPETNFQFSLDQKGNVNLTVYNVLGEIISTLKNEVMDPGSYTVRWNAGQNPSGVYFYRLTQNGRTEMGKILLLK